MYLNWNDEHEGISKVERREKDSDLKESLEGVFDAKTLRYLYDFMRKGVIKRFITNISQGKEARVYQAEGEKGYIAIKIFFTSSSEYYKTMPVYMEGDPRFSRLKRGDRREIVETWARKEFANLSEAYAVGVHVPKPLFVKGNVLIMQFIGGLGRPAPTLREVRLSYNSWSRAYKQIISDLQRLVVKAGLVHADLSEYNILFYRRPYIIDMGQAVMLSHPGAEEFLVRDLNNLNNFFSKKEIGLKDLVKEDLIKRWLASHR